MDFTFKSFQGKLPGSVMIAMKDILETYLKNLEAGDAEAIVKLFSEDGIIHSPLYGDMLAKNFYKDLFADTIRSTITLVNVFQSATNANTAAVHFKYEWTLRNGTKTNFEAVDIFSFDKLGKIKAMTIIYDTAQTRSAFEKLD
ncbi:MAG TPA: nuclear transport factor 2 family protein [Chitinophagaceae bacterium]|jgi:ketosteroid isomerase-like protein